jgi:regulator of CtrA degradation
MTNHVEPRMHRKIADGLYLDAMLLADEARSYFEEAGRDERDGLESHARVAFSCESLKVTTRLMHVLAFLLTRRAVEAGELSEAQAREPSRRLDAQPPVDAAAIAHLPERARALVEASGALHRRAAALDLALAAEAVPDSPALAMQRRLSALL